MQSAVSGSAPSHQTILRYVWMSLHSLLESLAREPERAGDENSCSVQRLCADHWRLCVRTCRHAKWLSSVLKAAGLAERGLAGEAISELAQRWCELLLRTLKEFCALAAHPLPFLRSVASRDMSDNLAASIIKDCFPVVCDTPERMHAAATEMVYQVIALAASGQSTPVRLLCKQHGHSYAKHEKVCKLTRSRQQAG